MIAVSGWHEITFPPAPAASISLPDLESGPRLGGAAALYAAVGSGFRRRVRFPRSPLAGFQPSFSCRQKNLTRP
jgi:hypothetical protein